MKTLVLVLLFASLNLPVIAQTKPKKPNAPKIPKPMCVADQYGRSCIIFGSRNRISFTTLQSKTGRREARMNRTRVQLPPVR